MQRQNLYNCAAKLRTSLQPSEPVLLLAEDAMHFVFALPPLLNSPDR